MTTTKAIACVLIVFCVTHARLHGQSAAQIQVISGRDPGGPCAPSQSIPSPPLQFNVQTGNYFACTGTPPNLLWTQVTVGTGALKGDGKGGSALITGTGSNCAHVDGSSGSCGGGAPTGAAGGDLSGTYPNPNVANINGVALSGLATGPLCNTTTTGVPSICTTFSYTAGTSVGFGPVSFTPSGTVTIKDATATTGVTILNIFVGAGQANTNLIRFGTGAGDFGFRYVGGVVVDLMRNDGSDFGDMRVGSMQVQNTFSTPNMSSGAGIGVPIQMRQARAGSNLVGIYAAATSLLEIDSGVVGTYADLILRSQVFTATAAATLANSQCTMSLTTNTTVTVTCKGSDGTTRTSVLTLS